jgi:poly-beta-1,6-N-acetyl-D-glucosamine biosynthesis protein PgaD
MSGAHHAWPPLIVADQVPRAVRWRDFLVTLLAWIAFVALLDEEFMLTLGAIKALGLSDAEVQGDTSFQPARLVPYLLIAATLGGLLFLFSLRTLRRRARGLTLPAPEPLAIGEQARGVGLSEDALAAARRQRTVIVHNDDSGLWIEGKGGARGAAPPAK